MKRRNQSQIILNFFTLASIIIISVTLTLYVKYIAPQEKEKQNQTPIQKQIKKLVCEKDSFTSYKVFNQALLEDSLKALDGGFYKLSGGYIEKADILKTFISQKEMAIYFEKAIAIKPKEKIKKYLTINYELIEGPNKKSTCKFCEANLITSFRAGHKELFRMDTDILLLNKSEIQSRIECIIKVYKNHGK